MVPGDPSLHCSVNSGAAICVRRALHLDRDTLHRPIPERAVRLRRGSGQVGTAGRGVRLPARHRSIPAVQLTLAPIVAKLKDLFWPVAAITAAAGRLYPSLIELR